MGGSYTATAFWQPPRPLSSLAPLRSQCPPSQRTEGQPGCFVLLLAAGGAVAKKVGTPPPAITLTAKALAHLSKLKSENGERVILRMGVKSGGCRQVAGGVLSWVAAAEGGRSAASLGCCYIGVELQLCLRIR